MPTYISLIKYTTQGIQNMKESPTRLGRAKEIAQANGGELTAFYLTMGGYDAVVMSEYPSDEAAAKALLTIGRAGAVQTETLRAFTEDEYRKLVDSLP